MKYLAIDGNSIINRAFYGIKLLSAKDGHFTNAIYGFMNIMLSLKEKYSPDAIIVAFDVHQPTFRHEMYSQYKAGRKSPPSELLEQFDPLKKLLKAYGCTIIECPGYEADDILGTLSAAVKNDDICYIATGDRDALQLVSDNTTVLLTTTKFGKTQTTEYNIEKLFEDYGVSPSGMIEIKALQGDTSDNIPGVAGIGPKTAGELIAKYGSIENIYENIDTLEVTAGVKNKLINGKDSAFFSKQLGTICLAAPINANMTDYLNIPQNTEDLISELEKHEMFKMISRLKLDYQSENASKRSSVDETQVCYKISVKNISELKAALEKCEEIYFTVEFDEDSPLYALFSVGDEIVIVDGASDIFDSFIKKVIESQKPKITDDCKKLFSYCVKKSIQPTAFSFDIKLAAYLLDVNSNDYSCESLALAYKINASKPIFENTEAEEFFSENTTLCNKALLLSPLANRLKSVIEERNEYALLTEIEIPLAFVLESMQQVGMKVDIKGIQEFSNIISEKISKTEQEIYSLAGEKFNINSPKQLGVILFEKLQLPAKKKTKTGYSTNAEVLEALAEDYPIVSLILEYRTYSKLKSTYCDGLLKAVDSDSRVRCTFNQTETRTGRLSSTEPNLQNIPVRTALGKEMRKFFIAEDGFVIIDADYSQIELRVLAALADDKNMLEAFNSDIDIHSVTASKVFGVDISDVSDELRSKAKAVNFGIVYGIGAFSLAKDIKSTRAEADNFIKSYLSLYSSVDKYMNECITKAKENGYAQTLFNRRRYLPELSASNGMVRSFGERVARNMPIQGTAADIIKIAMIKVFERLKNEFPRAKLIMQVHDELMAQAPIDEAEAVAAMIKEEMENAAKLSVKLIADVGIGDSWYNAKA